MKNFVSRVRNKFLSILGFRLVALEKPARSFWNAAPNSVIAGLRDHIHLDPLNPQLHFELAKKSWAAQAGPLAYAQLKTARYLGWKSEEFDALMQDITGKTADLSSMNHNQYYRLISLANTLDQLAEGRSISVLDVGGGQGWLARFLPEYDYCLAEPTSNGIRGEALPFDDESFDFVVSCHVLEHIEPKDRELFLDTLLAKSKRGVVLLNPFHVAETREKERLELCIDITNAGWAKEHLDCTLPDVSAIEAFASDRALDLSIEPNGNLTTSFALVFMDFFAGRLGATDSVSKVNRFFNTEFMHLMDSEKYPTAYLMVLKKPVSERSKP